MIFILKELNKNKIFTIKELMGLKNMKKKLKKMKIYKKNNWNNLRRSL